VGVDFYMGEELDVLMKGRFFVVVWAYLGEVTICVKTATRE